MTMIPFQYGMRRYSSRGSNASKSRPSPKFNSSEVRESIRISIFDLDRTLTKRPTYSLFLIHAAWRIAPWRIILIPLLLPYAIGYFLKFLSRKRMKEAMHMLMLGRHLDSESVRDIAEAFADRVSSGGFFPAAVSRIRKEAHSGRRIIIATAAPVFYATSIARRLEIKDVVGTLGTWRKNQLCPEISGENCHGAEKRRQVANFLSKTGIARDHMHVRFFSDDMSDLPTFEWADEAIAVNPSAGLLRLAQQREWKILDWRTA